MIRGWSSNAFPRQLRQNLLAIGMIRVYLMFSCTTWNIGNKLRISLTDTYLPCPSARWSSKISRIFRVRRGQTFVGTPAEWAQLAKCC
ncbi:hypothetical protein niasHT_026775 [Heterodera trifolii]|uniref:Uncharacterized protein n=1 Tax=Heterodera trifolii TaxID=157864 RepID=A0ABD2K9X8_9BILA